MLHPSRTTRKLRLKRSTGNRHGNVALTHMFSGLKKGKLSQHISFNLEQRNGQSRLFSAIRTANGLIITSFVLILRAWVFFYVALFTVDTIQVKEQDFFLTHINNKLS